MNYREIQLRLAEASRLIDAGKLTEADRLIRSMLGKGMTPADLDANLGAERIRALREFSTAK